MQTIEIQTTQNVNIEYPVASVGDRVFAGFIDQLIMIGYLIAIIFFYIWLLNVSRWITVLLSCSLFRDIIFTIILLSLAL
ncbi:MAG: hypothetical protein U5J96_06830 [Ignavibacteriaceae bacterium]|nr:hypothetical protein [Ignavibacteriaceae bacterium]